MVKFVSQERAEARCAARDTEVAEAHEQSDVAIEQ